MRKYLTVHNNTEKGEKWSKAEYEVNINDDQTEFTCECGQFKHTGMLCSHVLRANFRSKLFPVRMKMCSRTGQPFLFLIFLFYEISQVMEIRTSF